MLRLSFLYRTAKNNKAKFIIYMTLKIISYGIGNTTKRKSKFGILKLLLKIHN